MWAVFKYLGPGFLVTVGFIDPGNWATNVVAGSQYGYALLWVVALSTVMLILLQHNAAHLGIATGLCLAEAATRHFRRAVSRLVLYTALLATVATAFAEVMGAAVGLNILFRLPIPLGALLVAAGVGILVQTNGYRSLERTILVFVAIIGFSFLVEVLLVHPDWRQVAAGTVLPRIPAGSMAMIMGVVGAVVMPHNLFLHSEVIQSRQWHLEDEAVIHRQLRYEFLDTLASMLVGWAINAAMLVVAAAVFFRRGVAVTTLPQAAATLQPLVGELASLLFSLALLLAGISASATAAMAGGTIFAGMFGKPIQARDPATRTGMILPLAGALLLALVAADPLRSLVWSQVALSIQLPVTAVALVALTSSRRVMGKYANSALNQAVLWAVVAVITVLNALLVLDL
ncbi:MAG: Nramp family divalent metal transporter [Firmicutes bacterium]|nr:Nramp family divalent metal transporter [Bacillota bacterium]